MAIRACRRTGVTLLLTVVGVVLIGFSAAAADVLETPPPATRPQPAADLSAGTPVGEPVKAVADSTKPDTLPITEGQNPEPAPPQSMLRRLPLPKPDTSFWQKPTGKLFKSVIFPGWGQYANRKYQKAAIFFTLETFFIIKSVQYFGKTRQRFDEFTAAQQGDDASTIRASFNAYDAARKTRDKYYWFVAGTVFISMWDAFADAHLKPFEEIRDKDDDFWGLEEDDRPRFSPPPLSLAWTVQF